MILKLCFGCPPRFATFTFMWIFESKPHKVYKKVNITFHLSSPKAQAV